MDTLKAIEAGVLVPRVGGGDLNGYRAKPPLFPPGTPKSPFVREKLTGMIWDFQPYMEDMGDVLDPCWEKPDGPTLQIAVGTDISKYAGFGSPPPESVAAPQPSDPKPSVLAEPVQAASEPTRKGGKAKGQPRAQGGNA